MDFGRSKQHTGETKVYTEYVTVITFISLPYHHLHRGRTMSSKTDLIPVSWNVKWWSVELPLYRPRKFILKWFPNSFCWSFNWFHSILRYIRQNVRIKMRDPSGIKDKVRSSTRWMFESFSLEPFVGLHDRVSRHEGFIIWRFIGEFLISPGEGERTEGVPVDGSKSTDS